MALAKFCRVAPKTIRMLDLRQRVAGLTTAMELGFPHSGMRCPPCRSHRLGCAFGPSCVAHQPVIHVPWEGSLSCLSRCTVPQRLLLDGGPVGGHSDPLPFTGPPSPSSPLCRSGGGDIAGGRSDGSVEINVPDQEMQAVQNDYRAVTRSRTIGAGASTTTWPSRPSGRFSGSRGRPGRSTGCSLAVSTMGNRGHAVYGSNPGPCRPPVPNPLTSWNAVSGLREPRHFGG